MLISTHPMALDRFPLGWFRAISGTLVISILIIGENWQ